MRNQRLFFIMALVVLFSSARLASASTDVSQPPASTPVPHLSLREILKQLQLTDDQHKQYRQYRAAHRKKLTEIEGQLRVKKVELENELEKSEPDQVKLDLLIKEIADLQGQRLSDKVKAHIEFYKHILTPQQVDKLKTLEPEESSEPDSSMGLP